MLEMMAVLSDADSGGGDETDEDEYVYLGPGENPPEGDDDDESVTLSKEEYDKLIAQRSQESGQEDIGSAIANALKSMQGDQKEPINQQQNVPQQQPGESDEEFWKRVEEDVFKDGKTAPTMKEAIMRVVAPYMNQNMMATAKAERELLMLKNPSAKKYGDEIDKKVKTLPQWQQMQPGAYEWAYNQVLMEHRDDIIEEEVQRRLKEQSGGEEQGAQQTQQSVQKPANTSFQESGGMNSSTARGAKKRKKYVTPKEQHLADVKGAPIDRIKR
jgi:hypothetical protein